MRFLLVLLTLLSFRSFAGTVANCELVNGIYVNSTSIVQDLNFETLVDVFTLNNAQALNFSLDGKQLRFLRSDMQVNKVTKMIYLQKKNNFAVRAVRLMIDRTPKEVILYREFYGNMIISPEVNGDIDLTKIQGAENLVYNFHCSF